MSIAQNAATQAMFQVPNGDQKMPEHRYCEIIDAVFEIISSKAPTHHAARYIDDDVVVKMDDISARGFQYWCAWVEYMRAFSRIPDLTIERRQAVINDNCMEVSGIAYGKLRNNKRVEKPISVKFFFVDNRITEIYTSRFNYTAVFGEKIKYKLVFYLLVLRMLIWMRLSGRKAW